MKLETARDCFVENMKIYGDPKISPEKFKLYNGLANLAEAMMEMQVELNNISGKKEEDKEQA